MSALSATIEGVGFWTDGIPSWQAACDYAVSGVLPDDAPARPSPQLLAPNERRRAPGTVAVALEVGLAACRAAGREPASLPSVFASMHGELAIADYMCETLAGHPDEISPTRFHNSVHNAAAGYWTIGAGAVHAATAVSAYDATFAQGLLEALMQLSAGDEAVLLVCYDGQSVGPLGRVSRSEGLLGAAFVLSKIPKPGQSGLLLSLEDGECPLPDTALARYAARNASAPMLPLLDALATGGNGAVIKAGPGRLLRVQLQASTESAHV
ncbi:MAG: beta-ketoacyl synthase chain length factor [Pseudomonadota bacterium]|nr:beta-ketoacyl synthase chain length factor [Pseudomonadota bacterium]